MLRKRTAHDYKFIRLIGEGSFSSVYLAVDADATLNTNSTATSKAAVTCCDPSKGTNTISNTRGNQLSDTSNTSSDTTTSLSSILRIDNDATTNNSSTSHFSSETSLKHKNIRKYAIKVCQKSHIKRQNKQAAIMREKDIMNILNQHPNEHFIKLHCTFQDVNRLFFVMTYAENGELLTYMQEHPLSLCSSRKYTCQLVDALEHLHMLGIVHRDLKPENILLDEKLDILITDFGSAQKYLITPNGSQTKSECNTQDSAKKQDTKQERRNSFVGTAQYVSPEMLKNRHATNKSDLWALGVILYQMITNVMPFNAPNEYLIYQRILSLDYEIPEDFDEDALDLVKSLIKLEPSERLGANDDLTTDGYVSIRKHRFLNVEILSSDIDQEAEDSCTTHDLVNHDLDDLDKINPGLDESQLLRLLTVG